MKTIKEAQDHLRDLIENCGSKIQKLNTRLGSPSHEKMEAACALLSAVADGEAKPSEMTSCQWQLVALSQEIKTKERYEEALSQSDRFVVGLENMPPDAFRRKWASPAGFDPTDHAVFLEI